MSVVVTRSTAGYRKGLPCWCWAEANHECMRCGDWGREGRPKTQTGDGGWAAMSIVMDHHDVTAEAVLLLPAIRAWPAG